MVTKLKEKLKHSQKPRSDQKSNKEVPRVSLECQLVGRHYSWHHVDGRAHINPIVWSRFLRRAKGKDSAGWVYLFRYPSDADTPTVTDDHPLVTESDDTFAHLQNLGHWAPLPQRGHVSHRCPRALCPF